jgi:hypothetical protein
MPIKNKRKVLASVTSLIVMGVFLSGIVALTILLSDLVSDYNLAVIALLLFALAFYVARVVERRINQHAP